HRQRGLPRRWPQDPRRSAPDDPRQSRPLGRQTWLAAAGLRCGGLRGVVRANPLEDTPLASEPQRDATSRPVRRRFELRAVWLAGELYGGRDVLRRGAFSTEQGA